MRAGAGARARGDRPGGACSGGARVRPGDGGGPRPPPRSRAEPAVRVAGRLRARAGPARRLPGRPPAAAGLRPRPPAAAGAGGRPDPRLGRHAHFERTILHAGSAGSVGEVLGRRYELALDQLERGPMPLLTALALVAAGAAVCWRRALYRPVLPYAGGRAALAGGLVAAVAGSLVNNAGPVLLVYGVTVLATATAYARGDGRGRR